MISKAKCEKGESMIYISLENSRVEDCKNIYYSFNGDRRALEDLFYSILSGGGILSESIIVASTRHAEDQFDSKVLEN